MNFDVHERMINQTINNVLNEFQSLDQGKEENYWFLLLFCFIFNFLQWIVLKKIYIILFLYILPMSS